MSNSFIRFLLTLCLILGGYFALTWLTAHVSLLVENRLTQLMNEAVSGVR